MSNMGHCRFSNTLNDLQDCIDNLLMIDSLEELSDFERQAAEEMRDRIEDYITNYDNLAEGQQ